METISNRIDYVNALCKQLTTWVTSEKDVVFFSQVKPHNKLTCGDVVPLRKSVHWLTKINFTIKYGYKSASFDKYFIPNPNDVMHKLWANAVKKAGDEKIPVLVYKKPYNPTSYIFISYDLYEHINRELISCNMIKLRYFDVTDAYVFELNEFLSKVKYKTLKKAVNQL
jgi:hypothetical protein